MRHSRSRYEKAYNAAPLVKKEKRNKETKRRNKELNQNYPVKQQQIIS